MPFYIEILNSTLGGMVLISNLFYRYGKGGYVIYPRSQNYQVDRAGTLLLAA